MSSDKKIVRINHHTINSKPKTWKRAAISVPKQPTNRTPTNIKREFINRIKQYQHKNQSTTNPSKSLKSIVTIKPDTASTATVMVATTNDATPASTDDVHASTDNRDKMFTEDFKNSVEYMKELSIKHKENTDAMVIAPSTPTSTNKIHLSPDTSSKTASQYVPLTGGYHKEVVNLVLPDTLNIKLAGASKPTTVQLDTATSETPRVNPVTPTRPPTDGTPYGCLKNGKKLTYRNWLKKRQHNKGHKHHGHHGGHKKTVKFNMSNACESSVVPTGVMSIPSAPSTNTTNVPNTQGGAPIQLIPHTPPQPMVLNSQPMVLKPQPMVLKPQPMALKPQPMALKPQPMVRPKPVRYVTKRTVKRRYTCGKSKKNRSVAVMLKNKAMCNKILEDKTSIKQKDVIDIKHDMYKKGLLKVGSCAPENLVLNIYENSVLTGDVKNVNKDTLMHNYINDPVPKTSAPNKE